MKKILVLLSLIVLFINKGNSAAPTISISVSTSQICMEGSNVTVTVTANINNAPTSNYTLHWWRNTTEEQVTNHNGEAPNTNISKSWTYTYVASNPNYFNTQSWKVVIEDFGSPITSNIVNVPLSYLEVAEKAPSDQVILYSGGDYDLVTNLFDTPTGSNYNWTFTYPAYPGAVYKNGAGRWVLHPQYVPSSTVIQNELTYTVSSGGCSLSGTVGNTKLTIINSVMPPFVTPISALPVCENQGYFFGYISMKPSCFSGSYLLLNLEGHAFSASYSGTDSYSGNYLYFFYFNPAIRNSSYEVTISVISPLSCIYPSYTGKIPVLPAPAPTLNGLPAGAVTNNYNFVSLCKASADTLTMRSNTSGGVYTYALYKWDGVTMTSGASITAANFNYTGFVPDGITSPFIPYEIYDKHIRPLNDDSYGIRVRYQGPAPCSNDTLIYIRFNSPIVADFSQSADTICYGNPINLTVNYPGMVAGDNFTWDFGDGTSLLNDPSTTVSHTYNKPGMYRIRFRTNTTAGTTLPNCESDVIDTVWVGAMPVSDFAVEKNFRNVKAAFQSKAVIPVDLVNTSDPTDIITKWTYVFEPGISYTLNHPDTVYQYNALQEAPYTVLHIATTKWGCKDTATRYIPIFPVYTPTPTTFQFDDFTQSNVDGWFHSGQYKNADTVSSWENRTPAPTANKIITASPTGGDVWITSKNTDPEAGYYNNEKSWVESPVYDISNLTLPMVSFNTWTNTDNLFDGASLQYAFVDSLPFGTELWHTLGKKNSGLDWYNSNTVIAKPGNDLNGWTGDTAKDWRLSAYNLDEPLDSLNTTRKLIRFRVVLGTNSDNTPGKGFAGFAFDNFFVGERNRRVLVEEFCDHVNKEKGVDTMFRDPQAILIQYHVRSQIPGDSINLMNPEEPGARALLYGVGQSLPRGVIDGILEDNTKRLVDWGPNEFFKRSLYVSPFQLKIGFKVDPTTNQLIVSDTIKKTATSTLTGPFVSQIAIVEMKVISQGDTFPNVLRNMLPNSAGTRIDASYDWSSDFVTTQSWSPFTAPKSGLMAVGFIQDENTKEIYQSNFVPISASIAAGLTVVTNRLSLQPDQPGTYTEVSLSPNPTSGDITLHFNGILTGTNTWTMMDLLGNGVKSGNLPSGISAATLQTDGLPGGMYYLKIEGAGERTVKKFSLIK